MNTAFIASLLATGAVATLSGMKGIETENIWKGLIFLFTGVVIGILLVGFGLEGSNVENQMTVVWSVAATATGSGLIVLLVQSDTNTED